MDSPDRGMRGDRPVDASPQPADLGALQTEQIDPRHADLDAVSTAEIAERLNHADQLVPTAVGAALGQLVPAIDAIAERCQAGGRLIYLGAGTAGRLAVLDASEIPPTFGAPPELVQGHIAGGDGALRRSIEGAEDDPAAGAALVDSLGVTSQDCVLGIAASGRTPFVVGALQRAHELGALTVALACTAPSQIGGLADYPIEVVVGPEVVAGSTRLKAGTAQKLVLNMISTILMVRLGKTFGNLMVDVQPTNAKLRDRAVRIVQHAAQVERAAAEEALTAAGGEVKTAIVTLLKGVSVTDARELLARSGGRVREALALG